METDEQPNAPADTGGETDTSEAMLSAIDQGIADAGADAGLEPAAGDEPGAGAADESDGETPGDGDGDAGPGDDPGTADTAGDEPGDDAGGDDATPDPVNDPIPDEIKGRTRERMESLVSRVKETTTELETVRTQHEDLLGMITDTQATPEQFGQALDYLRAVNSGDPEQIKAALTMVQGELAHLARLAGEPVPGVDLLANHQDLRDAVDIGDISERHALELAAARDQRQAQQQRTQQTREQTTQQEQQQAALDQGRADLNALDRELGAGDPAYQAKRAHLITTLKPVMARISPLEWAAVYREAYQNLPANFGAAPATPPKQQPLRPSNPAGGQQRAPTSMLDAVTQGLEGLTRS
jgi:hypothetical protein